MFLRIRPPFAALAIAALGLAACASGAPAPERDFATYQATPQPRAFAVTGGTLGNAASYATGWSENAATVDAAIAQALSECERYRNAASQPACRLYAIGDTVVVDADAATVARARCLAEPGASADPERCAGTAGVAAPGA
jgi:hypothetical protein